MNIYSVFALCSHYTLAMYFMEPMPARPSSTHRVYMYFFLRQGWHISFLEPDLITPLPRKLTFASPEKILEMYTRYGESRLLEDRSALEYTIQQGASQSLAPPLGGELFQAKGKINA